MTKEELLTGGLPALPTRRSVSITTPMQDPGIILDGRLNSRRALSRHLTMLAACLGVMSAGVVEGASGSAQARLYCRSVRLEAGSTTFGSTLEFSTSGFVPSANDELAPLDLIDLPSHFAQFKLDDITSVEPIYGELVVDVSFADANDNGFLDFFEVSEAVQAVTEGAYNVPGFDQGTIQATWSRPAGVAEGTCTLRLVSSGFGALGDFNHRFRILEYAGTLDYTTGTNTVTARLDVRGTEDSNLRLTGPVELAKSQLPTRYEELELLAGVWTNDVAETLTFAGTMLYRDLDYPTNYYGFIDFDDGDLSTAAEDYWSWILSIDDSNDADSDGIPDLSDDSPVVVAPVLALRLVGGGLELEIRGTVGVSYRIQSKPLLGDGEWELFQTLGLTNSTQVLVLPLPETPGTFWRVLAL